MKNVSFVNAGGLTDKEKKEVAQKMTPYAKGKAMVSNVKIPLKGKIVICSYQSQGNSIAVSSIQKKKITENKSNSDKGNDKKQTDPQEAKLQALIDSGEVTVNKNWYTFKGKNHNGKKAILKAIK